MDALAIQAAENFAEAGYPRDALALLLCELDGTAQEVDQHIAAVEAVFRHHGATSIRVSSSEEERALLWKGRKSAFPAVGRLSPDYYCMDGTIPRSQVSHVLEEISRLSEKYRLRCANVFHAGDGNLHPLIMYDGGDPEEIQRAEQSARISSSSQWRWAAASPENTAWAWRSWGRCPASSVRPNCTSSRTSSRPSTRR